MNTCVTEIIVGMKCQLMEISMSVVKYPLQIRESMAEANSSLSLQGIGLL